MTTTDPQPATRTDEELTNLAQAVEEAGLPELGPAQGRLFDAVSLGLVYRAAGEVDWRTDGPKPVKCGPLLARVFTKNLVTLGVDVTPDDHRVWELTDLGRQMNAIRNPGSVADPIDEVILSPLPGRGSSAHTLPAEPAPVAEETPAAGVDDAAADLGEVLGADTALAAADETCVGRTREELRKQFTGQSAVDLWHYAGQLKIKLRKAARKSELVEAILDAGFQTI